MTVPGVTQGRVLPNLALAQAFIVNTVEPHNLLQEQMDLGMVFGRDGGGKKGLENVGEEVGYRVEAWYCLFVDVVQPRHLFSIFGLV